MDIKKYVVLFIVFLFCLYTPTKSEIIRKDLKILRKEIIPSMKFSIDLEIPIVNGNFPTALELSNISKEIKKENKNYENYFINYYLPKLKKEGTIYATTNDSLEVSIAYMDLLLSEYSKYVKEGTDRNFFLEGNPNLNTKRSTKEIPSFEKGVVIITNEYLENGKLKVELETNLPVGMNIEISLNNKSLGYNGSISAVIKEGKTEIGSFSNDGKRLKKGLYYLEIIGVATNFQENAQVKKILGEKGINLKGKYISKEKEGFLKGNWMLEFNKKIVVD